MSENELIKYLSISIFYLWLMGTVLLEIAMMAMRDAKGLEMSIWEQIKFIPLAAIWPVYAPILFTASFAIPFWSLWRIKTSVGKANKPD